MKHKNKGNLGKVWLPFPNARRFARELNLKNSKEWNDFAKSVNRPDDIPYSPNVTYHNKGWKSWGDWLGTGNICPKIKHKNFLPFEKARKIVRRLKLKSNKEYHKYSSSGKRPTNIPASPHITYKNSGWISWGDFLGTGTIAISKIRFLPFVKSRSHAQKLKLKNKREWDTYCKSGQKPSNIPAKPEEKYLNDGWISWGDYLGTVNIATHKKQFLPFKTARKYVHSLKLLSAKEWYEYCNMGKKPDNIPKKPDHTYKNKGWTTWGDFLGTGTVATSKKVFLSYKKARFFVHKLKFRSRSEWTKYCKSGKKPENIPADVDRYYKNKGWIRWNDWLGYSKNTK